MGRHHFRRHDDIEDFGAVNADDQLVDALARGEDPSGGQDELAALLLELGDEVNAPFTVPSFEDVNVVTLDSRRRGPSVRSPWGYGLIGAAAATALIAGSGFVLNSFGVFESAQKNETVVELASTLDEVDSKADRGDYDGARALIAQARTLINELQERSDKKADPEEVTVTSEVPAPAKPAPSPEQPSPEPLTVTVTEHPEPVTETTVVQVPTTVTVIPTTEPHPTTTSTTQTTAEPVAH